jgi:hypothetical protein
MDHVEMAEEVTTLVFPEISGYMLKDVVSDIYEALVQVIKWLLHNCHFANVYWLLFPK